MNDHTYAFLTVDSDFAEYVRCQTSICVIITSAPKIMLPKKNTGPPYANGLNEVTGNVLRISKPPCLMKLNGIITTSIANIIQNWIKSVIMSLRNPPKDVYAMVIIAAMTSATDQETLVITEANDAIPMNCALAINKNAKIVTTLVIVLAETEYFSAKKSAMVCALCESPNLFIFGPSHINNRNPSVTTKKVDNPYEIRYDMLLQRHQVCYLYRMRWKDLLS